MNLNLGRWTAYHRFKFESTIQIIPDSFSFNRWFKFEQVVGSSVTWLKFIKFGPMETYLEKDQKNFTYMKTRGTKPRGRSKKLNLEEDQRN